MRRGATDRAPSVHMASLGKEWKVPLTGVDYTSMRINEEKAARAQGLVELAGDLGWGGGLQPTGAPHQGTLLCSGVCPRTGRLLQGHSLPPLHFPLEHGVREEKPNKSVKEKPIKARGIPRQ